MACAICEERKAKRFCPALNGEICSVCCGTGRENTITCPLDCGYLRDAHSHSKSHEHGPLPHSDIELKERFLQENAQLTILLARTVILAGLQYEGVIDSDLQEALNALVKTYRTMQSGLIYDSLPENRIAAGIFTKVQEAVGQIRQQESEANVHKLRDADVLGVLVFWSRMSVLHHNGRPKSRAFMDLMSQGLRSTGPEEPETAV